MRDRGRGQLQLISLSAPQTHKTLTAAQNNPALDQSRARPSGECVYSRSCAALLVTCVCSRVGQVLSTRNYIGGVFSTIEIADNAGSTAVRTTLHTYIYVHHNHKCLLLAYFLIYRYRRCILPERAWSDARL